MTVTSPIDSSSAAPAAVAATPDTGSEEPVHWVRVCSLDLLTPDRGRVALVDGRQIALFRLSGRAGQPEGGGLGSGNPSGDADRSPAPVEAAAEAGAGAVGTPSPQVLAIANHDPFSGAQVLSRGIVGDRDGVPKVASPVYKQSFDLRTGQCLDDPEVAVPTYRVRLDDGWVAVEVPAASGP